MILTTIVAQLVWIPVLLGVVALALAVALGTVLYLMIRGEYLRLPDDKPVNELDALTRLLGSFARFSMRSRRIIRATVAALVMDLTLSAAFGYLAVEFENQRCVPYHLITNANTGIRRFLNFNFERALTSPIPLTLSQRAQLRALQSEEGRDFPAVQCP